KDRDRAALDGFLNFRASFDGTGVFLALGQSLRALGLTFGCEAGHQGPDSHVNGLFGTFIIIAALGDLVQHLLGSGGEFGLDNGSALDLSGQNDRIGGVVRDEPVDEVGDAARMVFDDLVDAASDLVVRVRASAGFVDLFVVVAGDVDPLVLSAFAVRGHAQFTNGRSVLAGYDEDDVELSGLLPKVGSEFGHLGAMRRV